MKTESISNNSDKKKGGLELLFKKIITVFFSLDLVQELLKQNKCLGIADRLTQGLKGKGVKPGVNPFKIQSHKNNMIISSLIVLPLLWLSLFSLVISKRPDEMFKYFLIVLERFADSLANGFSLKYVIGVDLIEFHIWKTWAILFAINLAIETFIRGKILKNHIILHKTRELRTRCISAGFITEEGRRPILWTPSGVLIDLEKSNDEDFVKSDEVWLQMSMFAGNVKVDELERHLIFVHVGQKLREYYTYFADGQIEIKK